MLPMAVRLFGFDPQAIVVERRDRDVFDLWWRERGEILAGRFAHARRNVLPPGLVGRDAQLLRGLGRAAVGDEALPSPPRELVVVADADEREPGPRVLDIGIVDVGAIDHAVAVQRGRHMEVQHLARVRHPADVVDRAVISVRDLVRVFDDLIDEVAQVQDEAQPALRRGALVLPDHAAIGVLGPFVDALTRDERKADGARIGPGQARM